MSMVGIGTVRIKMFDGAVRDLTDVRYVPQMKNMISVGVVESKGLKVTLENGVSRSRRVYGCDEVCQRQELVLLEG